MTSAIDSLLISRFATKTIGGMLIVNVLLAGCSQETSNDLDLGTESVSAEADAPEYVETDAFENDVAFMSEQVETIVLRDENSRAAIAVVPDWQGRVMTATTGSGGSYGWLNRPLIAEGIAPESEREGLTRHIYAFGGADRFWIGPEGGQFSWYFPPGSEFEFEHWKVPAFIDTTAWEIESATDNSLLFKRQEQLPNWSGTTFDMSIEREVVLLAESDVSEALGLALTADVSAVAYESRNRLENAGDFAWMVETGMPSVWILGMLKHGPSTTVLVPFRNERQSDSGLGDVVKDDYFGKVPAERLRVDEEKSVIYFAADGAFRSKIGISGRRSLGAAGSWDALNGVLTIVQYNQPDFGSAYVNSSWEIQDEPFQGAAINSYNDGPVDGGDMLGPFYEIETSSPALDLAPGERYEHMHRTIHLDGARSELDSIAKAIFGVGLSDIEQALETETVEIQFEYSPFLGLPVEEGISRRDPSDVIYYQGHYYVWYSKSVTGYSGYDASVWYARSEDGVHWTEEGEALARGAEGSWDQISVFTPNILVAENRFYLFYTGVKPTPGNPDGLFENNSINDETAIGVAVADSPDGPFTRVSSEPVISTDSDNIDAFDSYRVDDAALIAKDGEYWLYYKGRSLKYGKEGPRNTKMGVAIASSPQGPYIKYENNPLTEGGHEVMVWPTENGLMTLLSDTGEQGQTLQLAEDGLDFRPVGVLPENYPPAPGLFRADQFEDTGLVGQHFWGVGMSYGDREAGEWPHLVKYQAVVNRK